MPAVHLSAVAHEAPADHHGPHPEPVPADRRLRLPVRLRDDRAGRARRQRRVAVPAADGLAERVRRAPGPRRRLVPARPDRRQGPRRPALPAGHDGARDELGHERRLDGRARRAADRPVAPRNDRSHTHRRTPTDYDADHVLLRTVRCVNGEVQLGLACEPVFDYGPTRARWEYGDDGYHFAVAHAPDSDIELRMTTDLNLGHRGPARVTARHLIKEGESVLLRAVVERARGAADVRRGLRAARLDRAPLAALARPRRLPRPPVARRPPALRAHAQGAHLRADGRDRRRRDDVAARDAGRRAQLGLPLLAGSATRRSRSGASTRSASTGRPTTSSTSSPTSRRRRRARCRSCTASTAAPTCPSGRSTTCPATRTRARCASATTPTRRPSTTCGARCSTRSTCTRSRATRCPRASGRCSSTRSRRRSRTGASPTAGSGRCAARREHFTSSKLMCWVALDRGARLAELREDWERATAWRAVGRRDPRRHLRARARRARRVHPALRHRGARRVGPADAARALPARRRRAGPRDGPRDRRRADRRRASCCATASRRPTTASPARRARSRSARSGSSPRCARSARSTGRDLCEKLLAYSSPLGLYAEEIDPRSGRHLGNFPQAFTHLALINAVMHVIHAEEDVEAGFSAFTADPAQAAEQDPPTPFPID